MPIRCRISERLYLISKKTPASSAHNEGTDKGCPYLSSWTPSRSCYRGTSARCDRAARLPRPFVAAPHRGALFLSARVRSRPGVGLYLPCGSEPRRSQVGDGYTPASGCPPLATAGPIPGLGPSRSAPWRSPASGGPPFAACPECLPKERWLPDRAPLEAREPHSKPLPPPYQDGCLRSGKSRESQPGRGCQAAAAETHRDSR